MSEQIRTRKTARGEIRVKKIDGMEYAASSESDDGKWHRVMRIVGSWCCSCKSFAHTDRACKHVAAMKATFSPAEPRPDPSRRRRGGAGRRRAPIKTPGVRCRFCRSTKFIKSFVRPNKYSNVQVYLCKGKCGRRFTPDDGFLYMTYRGDRVVPAVEDRCSGKATHDICDSLAKMGGRPHRSTLYCWFVKVPRMVTPFLMSLDYCLSEIMYADEIVVMINGVRHVIFMTEDGGTRMETALQIGRFKGTHSVRSMFKMDMRIRGFVPQEVRTDGATNFASAHKHEMLGGSDGLKSIHIRHIHLDGDRNTNLKESHNSTVRIFERSCRGLKTPHTTYMGMHQIHYNHARTHSALGMAPAEAAGVRFEDPNKWLAIIACAADYNNACKLGEKPPITDDPRRAGFQVIPRYRY